MNKMAYGKERTSFPFEHFKVLMEYLCTNAQFKWLNRSMKLREVI